MGFRNTGLLLTCLLCICLFGGCQRNESNKSLSDFGGIYAVDAKMEDLGVEVSGRLTGREENSLAEDSAEQLASAYSDDVYNNKLLRWGISRKAGNAIPNADPGAPQLLMKNEGIYLGDTSKKEIFLTFDEGYENGYTDRILDVLKENKVKAVFFITGPYLKDHQDIVRRMVEEGHEVGNHTIHHPSLPTLGEKELEEEILGLDRAFYEKFNKHMKFLRPPKGEYSERSLAITKRLGYKSMFWSFAYEDWYRDKQRGSDYAYHIVMSNLHNGAILLLHAVSKDNALALDNIIKDAQKQGYNFGDVNDIQF